MPLFFEIETINFFQILITEEYLECESEIEIADYF
jgi:hypothetical protein